ncbi:MAG: hypothetical protein ACRYG2_24275 [Janthinobacterium lividum]
MTSDRLPVRRIEVADDADVGWGQWPTTLPPVAQVLADGLDRREGVTFVVGENDSGKSTSLEGIAGAYGLSLEGGTRNTLHATYGSESELRGSLRLTAGRRSSRPGARPGSRR